MKTFWYLLAIPALLAQTPNASAIARAAATELAEGRVAELHARFTDDLRVALTEDLLRDPLIRDLVAGAGAFEKIESAPMCGAVQGAQSCVVPLLYKLARIRLRFTIDNAGHVAGMFVVGREAR